MSQRGHRKSCTITPPTIISILATERMNKHRNKAPEKYQVLESLPVTTPYLWTEFTSNPAPSSTVPGPDWHWCPESCVLSTPPLFRAPMRDKIAYILLNSPNKALHLSELKEAMGLLYKDFYPNNPDQLRKDCNTLRHHLSRYPEFLKVGKAEAGGRRGQLWSYDPKAKVIKQRTRLKIPGGIQQVQHLYELPPPIPMVTTQAPEVEIEPITSPPSPYSTLPPLDLSCGLGDDFLDFLNFSPLNLSSSPSVLTPPSSDELPITPPQSAFDLQLQAWPDLVNVSWPNDIISGDEGDNHEDVKK